MKNNYDRLFVSFIYFFNEEHDYYECHEVMEQLWLENGRNLLYQGLLQIAVGLYHHHQNNVSGAIKLLTAACEKLQGYSEIEHGIDLKTLIVDTMNYRRKLCNIDSHPFDPYHLDIQMVDKELEQLLAEMIVDSLGMEK